MRRLIAVLVAAVALASAAPSFALETTEKTAADFKKSGNEKMDASDYVGALEDYEAAQRLAPDDASLYYNIGRAHGLLGHNVEALAALDEFGKRATAEMRTRAQFDLLLAQTRARVAYLTVSCAPVEGGRILLGQKVVGNTPVRRLPVDASAGPVRLSVVAEGYNDFVRNVTLRGGAEEPVDCRLLTKATSGTLVITTEPPGATITIDGRTYGNPPVEASLSAGAHTVLARRDGYEDASVPVVVSTGDHNRAVPIALAKSAPVTSKWWFWTGVGVVVVGGVALTAALLTEKSPDSGTIPPGKLSAPLVRF